MIYMLLKKSILRDRQHVRICGSKSISNRLLVLKRLFGNITIKNLSTARDTYLLQKSLEFDREETDIHHAGTAMRFLTSYYAIMQGKTTILTGSRRMKERPIQFLVDALRGLGADIQYMEKEGYPPLRIKGKMLSKNFVKIRADVSSQFITSLLLIGAKLENGLVVELQGEVTSRPYLEMTLKLLRDVGIATEFKDTGIKVFPSLKNSKNYEYTVESDWSSASYFYSLAAIGRKSISLSNFGEESLQGDSVLKKIYEEFFGIKTLQRTQDTVELVPVRNFVYPEFIEFCMNDCPDIAQTACVTATALKIPFCITGLSTLKVKETDRLIALQKELKKIGGETEVTDQSIWSVQLGKANENITIETYNDHRMAMCFAPFCLLQELEIKDAGVVEKSYPEFWEDLDSVTKKTE
ncbi:MAG: 3-phosphoshikimate 1-carboxyvinyltransferase [Bergeyella sp.]|nr:3-phosphoshikimate 1-carboxyvinyltransferase [Bergeyella sp.]